MKVCFGYNHTGILMEDDTVRQVGNDDEDQINLPADKNKAIKQVVANSY